MNILCLIPVIFISFVISVAITCSGWAKFNKTSGSFGTWFLCEFAHSQIPPDDSCLMLDDDGFQLNNGILYHVKVLNSKETKCRQNRLGQCFINSKKGLMAERKEFGAIKFYDNKFDVTWFGCSQTYSVSHGLNFSEIKPDLNKCWWTPDKRYFVSKYKHKLYFTDVD